MPDDNTPEARTTTMSGMVEIKAEPELLLRFLTLHQLLKITAWCCRWQRGTAPARDHRTTFQPDELEAALVRWLRIVQGLHYATEVVSIKQGHTVQHKSQLAKLNPFLDENGVLRVGGRLKHAVLSEDERHPMIVPPESTMARLLIDSHHRRTLHGGVQLALSLLRLRYWIAAAYCDPQGRAMVKRHIHRCVTCTRWRAAVPQLLMGNLPHQRVTPARPFLRTGVDYAGPILIRTGKGRGYRAHKGFIDR